MTGTTPAPTTPPWTIGPPSARHRPPFDHFRSPHTPQSPRWHGSGCHGAPGPLRWLRGGASTGLERLASWSAMTIPAPPPFGAGRFAPSPSADLHVGNLRTALLAWLFARSSGRRFLVRMEDLDRVVPGADAAQLADLAAIGLDWDGPIVHQSQRGSSYQDAIARLSARGLTYECFCTRREIREAASAPHPDPAFPERLTTDGSYPGTCRPLTEADIAAHRRSGRPSALRLRAGVDDWTISDELTGAFTGAVDDLVLRRNDGIAAYNLAGVVDDAGQGVVNHHRQVVCGDPVVASEHEIVDGPGEGAGQLVGDRPVIDAGPQAQRARPAGSAMRGDVCFGQWPARPRVGAVRGEPFGKCRVGVRSGCRLPDFPAGAEALVGQSARGEPGDRILIGTPTLGLVHDRAVPVQTDRRQIGQLGRVGARDHPVQVFHAHQEPSAAAPGEQPGQQGGAEVADVQVSRRAGSESAGAERGRRRDRHRRP